MTRLPDASVDMILCDLPYGTTACKWDAVIPFEPLWAAYRRIAKPNAAIVLTAMQPFTTALIASNLDDFRYEWIWVKNLPTGFANARLRPMTAHENICVFYKSAPIYNKQPTQSKITDRKLGGSNGIRGASKKTQGAYGRLQVLAEEITLKETVCPRTTLDIPCVPRATGTVHPTQKPVALMEYLIRTYTNEGDTVLDNCMGSGTTGVACNNTGRNFIGIERDPQYFEIAKSRIGASQAA
jgi:site-specific DNA-methyltransferase (adenine-specific)